jgi:arylsulfatase A-like enzyme
MLRAGLLFVSACALAACSHEPRSTRPNVILITLDTVRADHLGCYGYALPTTPNLDALAADAVRFEQCASAAALTPVSHASILTGLNPYRHGLRVLHAKTGDKLPESVPTLATALGPAGYATAAMLSAFPVSEAFGFDRGFEHFDNGMSPEGLERKGKQRDDDLHERNRAKSSTDARQAGTQRRSDATIDAVLAWLASAREPSFTWIHLWDVHDPILVPPADAVAGFQRDALARSGRAPELYDVELSFLDAQLGRLFARLRESGRYDDTLIVVTADHGEGLGEHGWHAHRLLYEEQLHVPLIVKLPRGPRGTVVEDLVRTIDIFPTVLEVADVAAPKPIEGRSLVALARGGVDEPRVAYADQLNKWDTKADMLDQRPQDDLLHSLRSASWKLIYRPLRPATSELYDLANDPHEARNLYAEQGERANAMLGELNARKPWVLHDLGEGSLDDHAADALRELGYMGDGKEH